MGYVMNPFTGQLVPSGGGGGGGVPPPGSVIDDVTITNSPISGSTVTATTVKADPGTTNEVLLSSGSITIGSILTLVRNGNTGQVSFYTNAAGFVFSAAANTLALLNGGEEQRFELGPGGYAALQSSSNSLQLLADTQIQALAPFKLPLFALAAIPNAGLSAGCLICVTDRAATFQAFFSDAVNWVNISDSGDTI